MTSSYDLYAIHDAWFNSLIDGDVDDRGAIKFYECLIKKNPSIKIMVYFTDNRYSVAKTYYTDSNIVFRETFDIEDVKNAKKIGVFSRIKDKNIRDSLTEIIKERKNGFCQGNKIGTYNFIDEEYSDLLNAMTHKLSTDLTNICFPTSFLDVLDPEYKDDYLAYGLLKLIAIGGIIHMPNLIYRLYCPGIGGGPGTNMLKIQSWFKGIIPELEEFTTIDESNFQEVNSVILKKYVSDVLIDFKPFTQFMEKAVSLGKVKIGNEMVDINIPALENSLMVMIIFGNLVYKPISGGSLFNSETKEFYSLINMPKGNLLVSFEETPPLYDLVAAYCMFEENYKSISLKEDIMKFFNE